MTMRFPGEVSMRRERTRFMQTIEELTDEQFERGTTLCTSWAPRDVLAHIISTDRLLRWYLRPSTLFGVGAPARELGDGPQPSTVHLSDVASPETRKRHPLERLLRIGQILADRGNALPVRRSRRLSREELTRLGWHCANHPSLCARSLAPLLLGDLAMHHQDVLRGLGRQRDIPPDVAAALFREGRIWSWAFGAKQLRYCIIPTTAGGFRCGRGTPVRGSTEALALWLAGRRGIESELQFDRPTEEEI